MTKVNFEYCPCCENLLIGNDEIQKCEVCGEVVALHRSYLPKETLVGIKLENMKHIRNNGSDTQTQGEKAQKRG
jgi:DNA-directed RNA polymerase subunit M/transcription elongation factor TFIIS